MEIKEVHFSHPVYFFLFNHVGLFLVEMIWFSQGRRRKAFLLLSIFFLGFFPLEEGSTKFRVAVEGQEYLMQ